ncbi:AIM21 [Candida metapsilosis]|uniref:AIM21 n=1 Tax=Candida metapsilosis TaxID=273372 RepID=A0A8H7ZK20_9ASCO|nr:AIM21 [Candida metapsilosis]
MSESNPIHENSSLDEVHKTTSASSQDIPVIPPRPRSKNRAKSNTSLVSSSSGKSLESETKPAVKDELLNHSKDQESALEVLDAYGVDSEDHEEDKSGQTLKSDTVQRESYPQHSSAIEESSKNAKVEDSPMNYQTNDQDAMDGDKTPGNSDTKASFKEDIDETNASENEASSFNDDVETVLQEGNDSSDSGSDHVEHAHPNTENEQAEQSQGAATTLSEDKEINEESKADNTEGKKKLNEAANSLKGDIENDRTEKSENAGPSANDNPHEQAKEQKNSSEEHVAVAGTTPVIPPRPSRKSKASHPASITNNDANVEESARSIPASHDNKRTESAKDTLATNSTDQDLEKSSPDTVAESKSESPSSSDVTPKIPARPTKKQSDSKSTPKAPPPKPKKLSSRIQAFQQQLFNSSSSNPESTSRRESEAANEGGDAPRNSSVHRRVFESSGIPLPGMFNPALRPAVTEPSVSSHERSPSETKTTKRVRGPKGKRLPQAVSKANVVAEKSRSIEKGKLWEFTFKKMNDTSEIENETSIDHKAAEPFHEPAEIAPSSPQTQITEEFPETAVIVDVNAENDHASEAERSTSPTELDLPTGLQEGEESQSD